MRVKSRYALLVMVMVSIIGSAQLCFGAGFALYEGSARGNALGGAVVGRADDPSALFFNPAGITQLPGTQMMAGATFIMPRTDVTTHSPTSSSPGITTTTESNVWMPPHFYLTYQATDKVWLGLALFSPFGLGTEFNENWAGKYSNYKAVIQTVTINPNIAVKLNDQISLAAGLDVMYFDLTLKQKLVSLNAPFNVDSSLEGDSVGVGMNLAIHYKAFDWMKLGLSYRSQVKQNLSGDAKFVRPTGLPAPYNQLFNDTGARGSITLPDEVYFGAAFYPIKKLSVEVGGIWTRWSTYDALTIQYDSLSAVGRPFVTKTKDWKDVWRLFLGVEYNTTDWLDLRAGFVWDQEPTNDANMDYLVPANDRLLFSLGPGFRWKNWTLDLSYTYLHILNRDNVPARLDAGVLDSSFSNGYANMIGCSVGYKF